ncbi:MAG TPA: hypothetical protein VFL95_10630 [Gemmatimonadales bacterium]|nr:hypothetical protein [Gemmatimonadales bacterium]
MATLDRVLYPLPDFQRTPLSLVLWWERRRMSYNLIVGGAGLLSLTICQFFAALPPGPYHPLPLLLVPVYALLANLCYSAGWLAELGMRALWKDNAPRAGPFLWRQGVIFSVGLTLLPTVLMMCAWVVRVVLAVG